MKNVKITTINENSAYFQEVIALGNKNSVTLGFLPKDAYSNYASKDQIIVAILEEKEIIGYLLYALNRNTVSAYIVHLCVSNEYRRAGIASRLFEELVKKTKYNCKGIRVRCRREYEASKLWPTLGFAAVNEIPGRSKKGSILTVWWYDHDHPNLFSSSIKVDTSNNIDVVIDTSIFIDFIEKERALKRETRYLLADWMLENVEFCVTKELFNNINSNPDQSIRDRAKKFIHNYKMIHGGSSTFKRIARDIRNLYPHEISEHDESDIRQLAWTISADAKFFITYDRRLLNKGEKIFKEYGLEIIRPSILILKQDSIIHEAVYRPFRLAGSHIYRERVNENTAKTIVNKFRISDKEKKSEYDSLIYSSLANPVQCETNLIKSNNSYFALFCYNRTKADMLEMPLIRMKNHKLTPIIARHIVNCAIRQSIKENIEIITITDKYLPIEVIEALEEHGFYFDRKKWIKYNLPYLITSTMFFTELLPKRVQSQKNYVVLDGLLKETIYLNDADFLLRLENLFFPLKLTDLDIPSFIIPIKPFWAMHLFDYELSEQHLFGGDPQLILNIENVYYRSAFRKILKAPARILWYISDSSSKLYGLRSIRACSYLEEVIVNKPEILYNKYKHLGVYNRRDVHKVANNKKNKEIMAFKFSNTELFENPIKLETLRAIWKKKYDKSFHIQCPLKIDKKVFIELYKLGFKERYDNV